MPEMEKAATRVEEQQKNWNNCKQTRIIFFFPHECNEFFCSISFLWKRKVKKKRKFNKHKKNTHRKRIE